MRKLHLLLILVLVLSVAPTTISSAQDSVTLTFINWIGAEEAYVDDLEAMIAAFEEQNPNIQIESQAVPFNQSLDQLLVMSLGGTPPDVSMAHVTWVAPLAEAGVLAPLDDLLPNQDDYYEAGIQGKTFDGHLWAAPWAPSPIIIYYNTDLLAQAGFDEPPATWDEMIDMSYAVAELGVDEEGNTIYGNGISSAPIAGAGYFFLPWIWAHGGEYLDADGNIAIDSPETVAAFEEVQQLFEDGVVPSGVEIRDLRNLFAQGQVGFHWDGEFGVPIFAGLSPLGEEFADHYGIMQVPSDTPGEAGPTIFIEHTLVVYEDSPHKEEAIKFVDFLTGPEGMAIYNEHGGAKLPARASVAEIDFYDRPENAFMQPFIEAMDSARPLPAQSSAFLAGMEAIAVANQRVSLNFDDAVEVVADLQEELEELYAQ